MTQSESQAGRESVNKAEDNAVLRIWREGLRQHPPVLRYLPLAPGSGEIPTTRVSPR